MSFFSIRFFLLNFLIFFSFSSGAIYNLKTNKEGRPEKSEKKHWLLVAQGCYSCSEVLTELKQFCSGRKPSSSQIGFFVMGSSPEAMLKKLSDFKKDYEIFSGSPNEFYESYRIQGSPSLKVKGKGKSIMGKHQILKFLKKDSHFCLV